MSGVRRKTVGEILATKIVPVSVEYANTKQDNKKEYAAYYGTKTRT